MKNVVFCDVVQCGSCKNRYFVEMCRHHHQGDTNPRIKNNVSVLRLLVTANVVPTFPIHVTLIMEAIQSSETTALTRATRRNIPEDGILQTLRLISRNLLQYPQAYLSS
jgi:hypothetical protein